MAQRQLQKVKALDLDLAKWQCERNSSHQEIPEQRDNKISLLALVRDCDQANYLMSIGVNPDEHTVPTLLYDILVGNKNKVSNPQDTQHLIQALAVVINAGADFSQPSKLFHNKTPLDAVESGSIANIQQGKFPNIRNSDLITNKIELDKYPDNDYGTVYVDRAILKSVQMIFKLAKEGVKIPLDNLAIDVAASADSKALLVNDTSPTEVLPEQSEPNELHSNGQKKWANKEIPNRIAEAMFPPENQIGRNASADSNATNVNDTSHTKVFSESSNPNELQSNGQRIWTNLDMARNMAEAMFPTAEQTGRNL